MDPTWLAVLARVCVHLGSAVFAEPLAPACLCAQIAGMSASAGSGSLVASAATPDLAAVSAAATTVSIGSSNASATLGSAFATILGAGQVVRLRLAYSADTSLMLGADFSSAASVPLAPATRRRLLVVPSVQGAINTTVVSGTPAWVGTVRIACTAAASPSMCQPACFLVAMCPPPTAATCRPGQHRGQRRRRRSGGAAAPHRSLPG